jgi:uncharacterized protein YdhG (YjbR/CyaY superfamily)
MHPEIELHIARFPSHIQDKLKSVHSFISDNLPSASQKMAYGIPTFQVNGKNFIHYAGYSKHIGLYPGAKAIAAFAHVFEDLGYKYSKGAVQFPVSQELPFDLIAQIIGYLKNCQR